MVDMRGVIETALGGGVAVFGAATPQCAGINGSLWVRVHSYSQGFNSSKFRTTIC
jgi:hypothetical protein